VCSVALHDSAPSPSVTIEMQHRPLSLEPAVELSSSSKELEEFELEEFDEISIEEPNGLEENEMDEAEAEGPTQKVSASLPGLNCFSA
jgi:hypothetical protein